MILAKNAVESNQQKRLQICLVASAGGHITQLLKLSRSWSGYKSFCVTTTNVVVNQLNSFDKVYVVGECNREYPLRVLKVLFKCIKIAFVEKPDVVISTGAAAGCLMCFLCKVLGAKIIWLDSITNVEKMSLSGRMVRYIADLCMVQWPELTDKYNGLEYHGSVI
jgi:UDP-N-acetylglucosamine:LPS N-acetylglucosamine transferase